MNQGMAGSAAPATALPTGWINTGDQLGVVAGTGVDATTDGMQTVSVGTTDVVNVNFGIDQRE